MASLISGKIDVKPIVKKLDSFIADYPNVKKRILIKAQEALLNHIKRLAPRNTGSYADSWKKGNVTENTATIVTDQGLLYAILEFTGAPPQKRRRKPPEKPYRFKAKSGEIVFTYKIDWPGFDKIPHAAEAMKLTNKDIGQFIKEELEAIL